MNDMADVAFIPAFVQRAEVSLRILPRLRDRSDEVQSAVGVGRWACLAVYGRVEDEDFVADGWVADGFADAFENEGWHNRCV